MADVFLADVFFAGVDAAEDESDADVDAPDAVDCVFVSLRFVGLPFAALPFADLPFAGLLAADVPLLDEDFLFFLPLVSFDPVLVPLASAAEVLEDEPASGPAAAEVRPRDRLEREGRTVLAVGASEAARATRAGVASSSSRAASYGAACPRPVMREVRSSTCPASPATATETVCRSRASRPRPARLSALSTSRLMSVTTCSRLVVAALMRSSASAAACLRSFLREPSTPERASSSCAASRARLAVTSPRPVASSTYPWMERCAMCPPRRRCVVVLSHATRAGGHRPCARPCRSGTAWNQSSPGPRR